MYKDSRFIAIAKHLCVRLRKYSLSTMAKSRYEYVKDFETEDRILPNTWIVVRIDGKGFHRFVKHHDFEKPNDINALNLMNHAAQEVMHEFRDIVLSYGQSDEYSFVLRREAMVYNRRASKILTYITSYFTSSYVFNWNQYFPNKKLQYPPCFDGRIVLYPTDQNLRDYLSWRQADVHVNNLYNTVFWALVEKGGMSPAQAEKELRGTLAADKNEILFSQFNTNYNTIIPMFRKGTILIRKRVSTCDSDVRRQVIIPLYEDMIRDKFWKENPEILGKYAPGDYDYVAEKNDCIDIPDLVTKQLRKLNVDANDSRETLSKKVIET